MEPIKQYRSANNLSQEAAGRLLGVSQTMIALIEAGERKLSVHKCAPAETATGGRLNRYNLRPDVFGDNPNQTDGLPVDHQEAA